MFEAAHDWRLVLASLAVAMMAGFTGLQLTQGAGQLPVQNRKAVVSMAVALGGGGWSMHFIAMLGLNLQIQFSFDPPVTLISPLASILIAGIAFLILHFLPRTPRTIPGPGAIVGVGIPNMPCIGMQGMELCRPVCTFAGVALAPMASVVLSVTAFWVAYSAQHPAGAGGVWAGGILGAFHRDGGHRFPGNAWVCRAGAAVAQQAPGDDRDASGLCRLGGVPADGDYL